MAEAESVEIVDAVVEDVAEADSAALDVTVVDEDAVLRLLRDESLV